MAGPLPQDRGSLSQSKWGPLPGVKVADLYLEAKWWYLPVLEIAGLYLRIHGFKLENLYVDSSWRMLA